MNNNNVFDLLEADLRQAVEALHYTQPTPVQEQVIPAFLEGRDCLVQAKTGSGKPRPTHSPFANNVILKTGFRKP